MNVTSVRYMTIDDVLSSHFGFNIDIKYLGIDNPDIHTEDGLNRLITAVNDELEMIKKDPERAYHYALNVIKGRWPEGEEIMKSDPFFAYWNSVYIIKDRWFEGEEAMKKNDKIWSVYNDYFNIPMYD